MRNFDNPIVWCISCKSSKALSEFRQVIDGEIPRYSEFCITCERAHGPETLLRRYRSEVDPMALEKFFDQAAYEAELTAEQTQAEAKEELARRELAKRRLIAFIKRFMPEYKAGWVHHDICRRLERFMTAVENGESPCLMLFVPPRHGKSTIVSDFFPSWVLGHHPEWQFMSTSYSQSLPVRFSRAIRDRLQDPEYQVVFPNTKIRKDSQNVEEWNTTKGGMFRTAGVGGGITGMGAHILLIDDPVKDYEEAMSETMRENAYNWFVTTANSRLAPGGGKLLVMTRWHDLDLAGRILDERRKLVESGVPEDEIDNWEVIEYPAIADQNEYLMEDGTIVSAMDEPEGVKRVLRKQGEALHPDRYKIKHLLRIRNTMPPSTWSSLYQQKPVPDDGEFFKKEYFRFFDGGLPSGLENYKVFLTGDLAMSTKRNRDFTALGVFAMDFSGDLYMIDAVRARMGHAQIVDAIVNLVVKYDIHVVGIEHGKELLAIWPYVEQRLSALKRSVWLDETLKPVTDKDTRARPAQGLMQQGRIKFDRSQPWYSAVEHELLRFPNGAHDDMVDVVAWAARMSLNIAPPKPKYLAAAKRYSQNKKSWRAKVKQFMTPEKTFMTA